MSEVTQADRLAAARVDFSLTDAMHLALIEAFARHRTTHTAPLIAAMERAAEQLRTDYHVFVSYAELHEAKGTAEGLAKAETNLAHSRKIVAALTDLTDAIKAAKGEGDA